jgi:hypothetical protein
MRDYYDADPERRAKHGVRTARWMIENPERFAKSNRPAKIRRDYGITQEIAERTLAAQDGLCAICQRRIDAENPPKIDHCHATGRFRGILCQRCNTGIGLFHDNLEWLDRAITYLTVSGVDARHSRCPQPLRR